MEKKDIQVGRTLHLKASSRLFINDESIFGFRIEERPSISLKRKKDELDRKTPIEVINLWKQPWRRGEVLVRAQTRDGYRYKTRIQTKLLEKHFYKK